jgi:hypothetical protein
MAEEQRVTWNTRHPEWLRYVLDVVKVFDARRAVPVGLSPFPLVAPQVPAADASAQVLVCAPPGRRGVNRRAANREAGFPTQRTRKMIQVIHSKQRDHFETDWLSTYWHSSFDHHHAPGTSRSSQVGYLGSRTKTDSTSPAWNSWGEA